MFVPKKLKMILTNHCTPFVIGPKIRTIGAIIGETLVAASSGLPIAYIFGITSANTTIKKVITKVA